jgi:hypothetical protein
MSNTTGDTLFNLDFNEIAEEAYERCGIEMRTGYQLRTARRSLNLLTIEWANRGINMWTIEQGEIPLITGQGLYPIDVDTIDILDAVIRQNQATQNQIDINITRISETMYLTIPNKLALGRPIQFWVNRQTGEENATSATLAATITASDTTIPVSSTADLPSSGFIRIENEVISYASVSGNNLQLCARGQNGTTAAGHNVAPTKIIYNKNLPSITVWPTPDAGGGPYTFVYYRMRRIQDAGSGTKIQDIPFRMLPALISGLAYHLAVKNPESAERVGLLKQIYDEQWNMASTEDREKASLRLAPRQLFW